MGTYEHNATLARDFLTWLGQVRGRRATTIYTYAALLDELLRFAGSTPLGRLRLEDLERFLLRARTKTRGVHAAPGTLAREATTLRSLYAHLHQRGHVDRDPTVFLAAPKRPRRDPRPIRDDTWCHLWGSELPTDARVVLGLGFFLGLRRMEIVRLRPEHIEPSVRQLVAFERKGGGDHTLPYGVMVDLFAAEMPDLFGVEGSESFLSPLYSLAAEARREGRLLLLPWADGIAALASKRPRRVHPLPVGAIDPQIVNKRVRGWLGEVGLPNAFAPHALRCSAATNLARCGMPVQLIQRLLNHADIATTMRYVRTSNVEIEAWFANSERVALRHGSGRHG